MGRNKALLPLEGSTVIERVVSAIPARGNQVKLVTNSPADYGFLGLPCLPDVHPGLGPMAGIHAGLTDSVDDFSFFLACDLPLLEESSIRKLMQLHVNQNVLGYRTKRGPEPLCAIYAKAINPVIEKFLEKNECALHKLCEQVGGEFIEFDDRAGLFNLNTLADWRALERGKHPQDR